MLRFLLFLSSIGGFLFVFFPQEYYVDLLISFLPYLLGLYSFVSAGLLVYTAVLFSSPGKKSKFFSYGVLGLLLLHLFWAAFFFSQLTQVYSENGAAIVSDGSVSVLYANVFVDNGATDDLLEIVATVDADLLFLVEFSDSHYRDLEDYLLATYPYINRETWDQGYDGTLIASRYPFSSTPRYLSGYLSLESFSLTLSDDTISVNVVHTASPLSERYFNLRNEQLDDVLAHLRQEELTKPYTESLLLGDFNVTPWSVYYKDFVEGLGVDWLVASASAGPLYTWHMPFIPFVQAHIDHVFARGLEVGEVESVTIPGSDHRGLYFVIASD